MMPRVTWQNMGTPFSATQVHTDMAILEVTSAPVSMRTDTLIQGWTLIGTVGSKQGDPLSALSVTSGGSGRFTPNNASLLAEGDTFLNLSGDPSRSVSKS
jgi:hypothetical protein